MRRLLYLPALLLLSMVSSLSSWNTGIIHRNPFRARVSIPQHQHNRISFASSITRLQVSNTPNTDDGNFDERLRKAYEEWSLTYGDTIDETRMEIFSYHFLTAENYFKETGNRIKLNEYADLTAVEFQRLKEMGGMIQDVGGSEGSNNNNPHWAPEDAAQIDFFAKQTSQRRQAFQDNSQPNQPETLQPPPGYFSVLPTPEQGGDQNTGGMNNNNGMGNVPSSFSNGIGGGIPATENSNPGLGMGEQNNNPGMGMGGQNNNAGMGMGGQNNNAGMGMGRQNNNPGMGMDGLGIQGLGGLGIPPPPDMGGGDPNAEGVSSFRDPYQQRFTQSYLDSLNIAAKDDLVDQTPNGSQPPPQPEGQGQNEMYGFGGNTENNENESTQDPNKYKQLDSFPQENTSDKPELQDLINNRYDGIGFLEDSAMVDNSGMDYKFFPALSKMYNLDYPDPQDQQNHQNQQDMQDMPPPPPEGMPGPMGDGFDPPPPPPGEPSPQERRETFMNAMEALYSQMFNDGGGGPPDGEAMQMMQNFMQQASGGPPPPGFGGPPPGQFGVPPQPGNFGGDVSIGGGGGGGGAPAGQWSEPQSGPMQMNEEDPYGSESDSMASPSQDDEEVGTEIYLGEMSYKMSQGRVIEWLKKIGDEVERGEPLCVVESDTFMIVDGQKYAETHDVVAQEDGILASIYIEVQETVPVGSVLGVVAADMAEASLVRQTLEQKKVDFEEQVGVSSSSSSVHEPEEVFLDENGYPVDEDGYLLDSVEVDEEGYPIYDYVDGYPVDEDGYVIEDYDVDEEGFPIEDEYDENGYEYDEGGYEEGGGYEEEPPAEDGWGEETMYTGPVDDDPDLPSWVLGDAPSIAPAKVASKHPVIPKMGRPAPSPPPPPKKVASRRTAKRSGPKGGRRPGPNQARGRIDDVRSPARKGQAAARAQKPKIEGAELILAELSSGMTKGTVIEWIKNVGDPVRRGEPLAVVESDTFMIIDGQKYAESHDVEASQDGILAATYAGVKETLEVGALLGIISENAMAARNVPQSNPYASGGAAADEPDKPLSRTQRAVAEAIQASTDPVHRARPDVNSGFLDSVEQVEEDAMAQMGGGSQQAQQDDEFAKRFMSQDEREAADFAAAGSYDGGGGGGGGGEQYTNEAIDDPDLPSWVRGDAPSLAPAKVASRFPVIPKIPQPGAGTSPSVNAINKAREATMQQKQQDSQMHDNGATPPGRGSAPSPPSPRGSAPLPPKRRGAPPKRRGAPPKRRGERPSGRGRIDDTRAPLNQPEEEEGTEIVLSELSYGMKKGMIIEWLKSVGDPVKKGEPIAVVESDTFMVIDTQKYAESHDILATDDGILAAQLGGPKELFDVGAVLGMITDSETHMRNMRRSSPPPPSHADANGYNGGWSEQSSFYPEETNVPGETAFGPPDPAESSGGENYLDDPDLPSWVRGDAPSIAPAKVASKYPVIPNMRRGAPPPQSALNPPRTPPVPVNGGTQRRIPKGRYDDTRARPKQIRVVDKSKQSRPRGRIDDIRAPLNSEGGSTYVGGSTYTASESTNSDSKLFPDLSTPKNPKSTNRATPKATRAPPADDTRFMPDLSNSLKPKKKKTAQKKDPPRKPRPPPAPVVDKKKGTEDEEPVEEPAATEEENIASQNEVEEVVDEENSQSEEEESLEPVIDEGMDTIEEDVVESAEDSNQDPEDEDAQSTMLDETEGEEAVFEEDEQLEADEETMVDASNEIEPKDVEESKDLSEELLAEDINGEDTKKDNVESGLEVEEESSSEAEMIANGGVEIPVKEEGMAEEEVVTEEAEERIVEERDANVTAKVDIRDLKKEKTAPTKEPTKTKEFDYLETTTNSTDAMVQEILVTAKARNAAEAAKIDLTTLQGTGEAGCITLDDVKLAIARKKPKQIGIRFLDKPKGRPNKKDK